MNAPARTELDASLLRRVVGPLLLMGATPPIAALTWVICVHFGGSIAELVAFGRSAIAAEPGRLLDLLPRPTLQAAGILFGWITFQALLLRFLPGPVHLGPVTPKGNQPAYRKNGLAAWWVTHATLVLALGPLALFSPTTVYAEMGAVLTTSCLFALAFCLFLYWKGRTRPSSSDAVYTGHFLFDFFQGVELHPTLFGMNLKQLINCRVSMMGWSALSVVFAAHAAAMNGHLPVAIAVSTGLIVVYLYKFFMWETGYFASLDIMHDRFGYYICWGVLVWVPAVYTLPPMYLAGQTGDISMLAGAAIALLGLGAIWMNYAADAQRQRVRQTNGETKVFGRPPELLRAAYRTADGQTRENLLLVSGYWGWARHFHYIPELGLSLAWTLPAGFDHFLPYFYWFFLAGLLFDRASRDDKRCQEKYGATWDTYRGRVRWKIVPGLY